MKRVIIESPYAGDIARNETYARRACADAISRGESPFASHIFYTQSGILDENKPEERKLGIECGYEWMKQADLVAFYSDYEMSPGMLRALDKAVELGKEAEMRKIGENP